MFLHADCKSVAKLMFSAVRTSLGCEAFRDSQEKACLCSPVNPRPSSIPRLTPSGGDLEKQLEDLVKQH